ncbi:MAG: hypothetical protein Q9183_004153 [Haloplaca sp. 2 TL-2023]
MPFIVPLYSPSDGQLEITAWSIRESYNSRRRGVIKAICDPEKALQTCAHMQLCSLKFDFELVQKEGDTEMAVWQATELFFTSTKVLAALENGLKDHQDSLKKTVAGTHTGAFAVWNEEMDAVRRKLQGWKVELEKGMFGQDSVELEIPVDMEDVDSEDEEL